MKLLIQYGNVHDVKFFDPDKTSVDECIFYGARGMQGEPIIYHDRENLVQFDKGDDILVHIPVRGLDSAYRTFMLEVTGFELKTDMFDEEWLIVQTTERSE